MDSELLTSLTTLSSLLQAKLPALIASVAAPNVIDSDIESAERTQAVLQAASVAPEWKCNIKTVLFTPSMISTKVAELGARITKEYRFAVSTLSLFTVFKYFNELFAAARSCCALVC
jgi:hypothetical protein